MNDSNDSVIRALHPLRDQAWPGGAAGYGRVEQRLLEAHSSRSSQRGSNVLAFVLRHRLATAALAIAALAGGAIAGNYLYNRLYSITISDQQGNVLTAPRVLVAPGQSASISIGDANDPDNVLSVTIDENGNVTSNRDDVNVDVKVQDVDENGAASGSGEERTGPMIAAAE